MNTIPNREAGHLAASSLDDPGGLSPSRMLDHHVLRPWRYRHMMRSPLIHPFRQMLRPVVRWLFSHNPAGVDPKIMTIGVTALAVVLMPLIFVMLLPLILILIPVAMLFGLIGLASTSVQTDADDLQHHSLTWHLMH